MSWRAATGIGFVARIGAMLLASVAFALAQDDAAQDDAAQRRMVASEYIGLSLETMDLDDLARQTAGIVLAQIEARQPDLYAMKAERLNALVTDAMREGLQDGLEGLDEDMAAAFSLDELTALRDFYATPQGRSVMSKMPAFMAAAMPTILQDSVAANEALLRALEAEGVQAQ